ncbi:MAG: hypothetical protein LBD74_08515, partial [Spirochaetaceae bacterium]|nr:hypothetical protein [Spirochaetaceae bacterium]
MSKRDFPKIHFYDQDFVDVYDKTWAWIHDCWNMGGEKSALSTAEKPDSPENPEEILLSDFGSLPNGPVSEPPEKTSIIQGNFFSYPGSPVVQQADAIFSSFFLVYSNRIYQAHPTLDIFYERQESDGAIRSAYNIETGLPEFEEGNPEGVGLPLFAWAEFNLYHKSANKKRVKDVLPILHRYIAWLDEVCKRPNGLYEAPLSATSMVNAPRENVMYPMDFNTMMAINVLYMSALADILNDKESSFQYKRQYFSLKTRINALMWDNEEGFYFDIDKDEKRLPSKLLSGYWALLAEIPNDDKAERL